MHIKRLSTYSGSEIVIGSVNNSQRHLQWTKCIIDRPGGLLALRNNGTISYKNTTQILQPGDMIIYDSLPRHTFSCHDEWTYYYFHFPEAMLSRHKMHYNSTVPGVCIAHLGQSDLLRIKLELQEAFSLFLLRRLGWEEIIIPLLQLIIARFFQTLPQNSQSPEDSLFRPALQKLETFCHAKMSDLARCCNMSKTDFFRKFRTEFGCSPLEYRDSLLVSRAKILLCSTSFQIQEIALQLGFLDSYYFSKFFHSRTGFTPSKYRRENKGV